MPTRAELEDTARAAARQYGIPEDLFVAQIQQESSFNPNAFNPAGPGGGAQGIAQFIPSTAAQYGVTNPYDPSQALYGAAAYDAALFKQKGSWLGVLQGYGTIPTQGPLTASQQAIAQQAQGLGSTPGAQVAGGANPLVTPVGFPSVGGIGSAIGSFFWDVFMRIVVILIGIVLVWQGLAMLRGSSVKENVTVVVKNVRGRASKAA